MLRVKLLIISVFLSKLVFSQTDSVVVNYSTKIPMINGKEIFVFPQIPPSFPGGSKVLQEYIQSNLNYDIIAFWEGVEGKVQTSFLIHEDGSISDIRIIKGIHPDLDRAVVEMIQGMPNWIPGQFDKTPVVVNHFMPVKYKIGRTKKIKETQF